MSLAALLASAWLWPAPVEAQVEPIRLTYRADARCPDERRFLSELSRRTNRVRPAAEGEASRTLTVTIAVESDHIAGVLEATALDGSVTRRQVTDDDCEEVMSALALIAALTIDPRAMAGNLEPLPPVSPPAPSTLGEPSDAERGAGRTREATEDSASGSDGASAALSWAFGVEAQSLIGLVPVPAFGGGVFAELARRATPDLLISSLRLSVLGATANPTFEDGIGAEILWVIGRLQACPAGLGLGPRLRIDGCLAFDGGLLRTRGTGLDQGSESKNPWFSMGAAGRLAWVSSSGLTLEVGAGLMAPLRRYPFLYESGGSVRTVHRMPFLGGSATIGAGFRFP